MTETRRACFVALAISVSVVWAHDSPLSYPTPPNPFGDSSTPPPPSGGGDGDGDAGLEKLHLPPRAVASARVRRPPVLRRLVCLGALSAVCFASRPHEPSLLAAIEAHHTASGDLVSDFLRSEPVAFRNVGLASVGLHSDLVWLGLLGQWLPLLPTTIEAFRHWSPALRGPQLLLNFLVLGYVLTKLGGGGLHVSFGRVRRARIHTALTAAFSPDGLVPLLHAVVLALAALPALGGEVDRWRLVAIWAAAGLCSSVASVVWQAVFHRRAAPRSSVGGALMGVLALRAALLPETPVALGPLALPPVRALAVHLLLTFLCNGAAPEELFGLLGGSVFVAVAQLQMREVPSWDDIKTVIKSAL